MRLNETITKAVDAVRGVCCCDGCGVELLRFDGGKRTMCSNLACPRCPIPPTPSPAAVRAGELRAAGYAPADHLRSSFPPPPRPHTPPEAPARPAPKSAAQRERAVTADIKWAQERLKVIRYGRGEGGARR